MIELETSDPGQSVNCCFISSTHSQGNGEIAFTLIETESSQGYLLLYATSLGGLESEDVFPCIYFSQIFLLYFQVREIITTTTEQSRLFQDWLHMCDIHSSFLSNCFIECEFTNVFSRKLGILENWPITLN